MKFVWSRGTGDKKYKVIIYDNKGKKKLTVQFGSKSYGQFKDTSPLKLYKKLDTNDKVKRNSYFKRHKKNYKKYSADWFSKKFLWSK